MANAAALKRLWRRTPYFNWACLERDQWIERLAATIPTGYRVLDVGSGTAPYRNLFPHCKYFTQDPTQNEDWQNRDGQSYSHIDYPCTLSEINPDQQFDVILCTEVLEHTPDPFDTLKQISRLLKQNGHLIISFPLWSQIHMEPNHFYGGFTKYWVERFFPEHDLQVKKIEKQGGFFKYYGLNSTRMAKLLLPSKLGKNTFIRILIWPLWVPVAVLFGVLLPVICYYLDPLDKSDRWTLGYKIEARKT